MNEIERVIDILNHQATHTKAEVDEAGFIDLIVDDDWKEALSHAITTLREKQERENPQPLTLKQLQERVNRPVYIHYHNAPEYGKWGIIEGISIGGAICFKRDYSLYDYGKMWLAYDYPPKEGNQ